MRFKFDWVASHQDTVSPAYLLRGTKTECLVHALKVADPGGASCIVHCALCILHCIYRLFSVLSCGRREYGTSPKNYVTGT
jgi:hypothetical protein